MPTSWEFKQSLFTTLTRRRAWAYWSDMQNHAQFEGVRIELDGRFESGTKGRTIASDYQQEWVLDEVIDQERFVISGENAGVILCFAWDFEDEGTGTRMTHVISAHGPEAEMQKWEPMFSDIERNAPQSLDRLTSTLNSQGGDDVGAL